MVSTSPIDLNPTRQTPAKETDSLVPTTEHNAEEEIKQGLMETIVSKVGSIAEVAQDAVSNLGGSLIDTVSYPSKSWCWKSLR